MCVVCRVLLDVGGRYNKGVCTGWLLCIFFGGCIFRMVSVMMWQSQQTRAISLVAKSTCAIVGPWVRFHAGADF